jgi:hypothetical protein
MWSLGTVSHVLLHSDIELLLLVKYAFTFLFILLRYPFGQTVDVGHVCKVYGPKCT